MQDQWTHAMLILNSHRAEDGACAPLNCFATCSDDCAFIKGKQQVF